MTTAASTLASTKAASTNSETAAVPVRGAMAVLAATTLLASLGTSSANLTLPAIGHALSASFGAVQWVVLSYLVAMTALAVTVGRIADLVGQRPVLVAGLLVFAGASLACGIAPGLATLVAARAIQGAGAAAMIAVSLAMVPRVAAPDRLGSAMGLVGTMSAIGTALGPVVGGLLIGPLGWKGVFLANVPAGLAAAVAAWRLLPPPRIGSASPRFDWPGASLLTVALTAYALAMTVGHGRWALASAALAAVAVGATVALVRVEGIAAYPVIPLATLRDGLFRAGFTASAVVSSVVMATLVVGPFHLSSVLGLDAAATGLAMSSGPVVSALAGMPAGRAVDRFGGHRVALVGLAVMILGASSLALVPASLGVVGYVAPLMVLTAGYALFQAANTTVVMRAAGVEARGAVSGMLSLSRNLGLITGAALLGAIYAAFAGVPGAARLSPASTGAGAHAVFAVSALLLAITVVVVRRAGRVR